MMRVRTNSERFSLRTENSRKFISQQTERPDAQEDSPSSHSLTRKKACRQSRISMAVKSTLARLRFRNLSQVAAVIAAAGRAETSEAVNTERPHVRVWNNWKAGLS